MRIGIISSGTVADRIPPVYGGGIQQYIWSLGRELNNLGHEVHIFTHQQVNQLSEEIIEGVYVHRISRIIKTRILSTLIFGFKTFLKILKVKKNRGKFHILHAQSRVSGLIVRLFLRKIPFVFTAHNWDIAFTSPGVVLSFFPHTILRFIEARIYLKSDKIIALTEYFKRILMKQYEISEIRIQVIPNMITIREKSEDTIEFQTQIKKTVVKPFLLFIGRLEKEKGSEYLLRIFKKITEQSENLNLVLVGWGSLREKLGKISIELNLKRNVYILGNIHEIQLKYLLNCASALILPSHFEIMPTVILEAWMAGCPVIVNRYYGVEALINNRITGLLFQNEQPSQLVSIVQELLNNQELRRNLIQNSKKQLVTKYSASRIAKDICELYKNLLGWSKQ